MKYAVYWTYTPLFNNISFGQSRNQSMDFARNFIWFNEKLLILFLFKGIKNLFEQKMIAGGS